ncbi:PaaI family thioesterase [Tsukamurella sp. 1534]|uniref:PaaI family thioesterase n=1 Tax=Tsukamurella sp. 1534 TaxID=1151061 RepID=UPI0002FC452A|nr:PaaI family thioesterase [Tsukamurella sp. 1534]
MSERGGHFWDFVEGRVPAPPAAATLGFDLIAVDPDAGTIEVRFTADESMLNPAGNVQGGFLAAMLDDTLGPCVVATLPAGGFAPTVDLHVQYLRPASPGRLVGTGRVVHRTRSLAFLAGELRDPSGALLATATATARIQLP